MPKAIEIIISTRVENPRPTTTGVKDGVDYDAEVLVTDEAGRPWRWVGEVTYAPSQYDGSLVPYGGAVIHWMSHGLLSALKEDWIAAHPKLVKAITRSLGDGEGIESFGIKT